MAGKTRPSLRVKTLQNVATSNLSKTDKKCIVSVFAKFDAMSKADVVEVVRCKDCTRRVDYEGMIMCNKFGHKFQGEWYGLRATTEDHFCSYGERKDDSK